MRPLVNHMAWHQVLCLYLKFEGKAGAAIFPFRLEARVMCGKMDGWEEGKLNSCRVKDFGRHLGSMASITPQPVACQMLYAVWMESTLNQSRQLGLGWLQLR